jgi:hypothetical protein
LSPTIGDSTMQFYLSMRNRDSKMDAWEHQILNWRHHFFLCIIQ